jgi:uncharacterized protein
MMDFEWDEAKRIANIRKHGVDFALACAIFGGPRVTVIDERVDYGETREVSIGLVDAVLLLSVVHTDRNGKVRLISARRANKLERKIYEEALRTRTDGPGIAGNER